ncbi:hypothetical protein [Tenacibaculum sp. Cn5-34]|nr:hypothetical protein [Tenacibaculum sp. Cn5-34]MCF2934163.1 hypothetical protein [Tenacibaculum sp. Cn5-34]
MFFRATIKTGGHIYSYKGWCSKCEIWLTKKVKKGEESNWKTSIINSSKLDRELNENEVHLLYKLISENNDSPLGKDKDIELWNEFISMKKQTDKIFECKTKLIGNEFKCRTFVLKRNSFLIGNFFIFFKVNAT